MVAGYGILNYITANKRVRISGVSDKINDSRVSEAKRVDTFYAVAGLTVLAIGFYAFKG